MTLGSEAIGLLAVGLDEEGERLGGLAGGHHEGELVVEVGGVLDEADDLVVGPADVDPVAEPGVEVGGGPFGESDLAGRRRPAALQGRDHRRRVRAVGLDRPELDRGGRARGWGPAWWPITSMVPNHSSASAVYVGTSSGRVTTFSKRWLAEPNSATRVGVRL